MEMHCLLEGYLIGFSVGTTIGVGGILCLQNMMTGQKSLGILSVFAAALADMTCGVLALFGLNFLQSYLVPYKVELSIGIGLLLCFIGLKRIFEKIDFSIHHMPSINVAAALGKVYFLGLIDPVSILDFLALSFGLTLDFATKHKAYQFILGIFLGSFSWWSIVLLLVLILKKGISVDMFNAVQKLVGAIILFLGIRTLISH
jgi:threonine/homoserine/homoserine lactone efflux protein